ncbi:MAG: endonuclease III [Armatimonadota bacterium]|nr:endonuclease III [Armatimonadota bacterium]
MSEESQDQKRERLLRVIEILKKEYPDAKCTLDFRTPHELLVAAILAAQCTDERVNQVTPRLFAKYPTVEAFAKADQSELEEIIKPTGFFHNKAKAIIESAQVIVEQYGGKVPDTVEELTKIPGVGRKTANLIAGVAYGKPAVIVDTHVRRVTARLGFTNETDPAKIEEDLWKLLPSEEATQFNHLIVAHGRAVCKAPKPLCQACVLAELCPEGKKRLSERLGV